MVRLRGGLIRTPRARSRSILYQQQVALGPDTDDDDSQGEDSIVVYGDTCDAPKQQPPPQNIPKRRGRKSTGPGPGITPQTSSSAYAPQRKQHGPGQQPASATPQPPKPSKLEVQLLPKRRRRRRRTSVVPDSENDERVNPAAQPPTAATISKLIPASGPSAPLPPDQHHDQLSLQSHPRGPAEEEESRKPKPKPNPNPSPWGAAFGSTNDRFYQFPRDGPDLNHLSHETQTPPRSPLEEEDDDEESRKRRAGSASLSPAPGPAKRPRCDDDDDATVTKTTALPNRPAESAGRPSAEDDDEDVPPLQQEEAVPRQLEDEAPRQPAAESESMILSAEDEVDEIPLQSEDQPPRQLDNEVPQQHEHAAAPLQQPNNGQFHQPEAGALQLQTHTSVNWQPGGGNSTTKDQVDKPEADDLTHARQSLIRAERERDAERDENERAQRAARSLAEKAYSTIEAQFEARCVEWRDEVDKLEEENEDLRGAMARKAAAYSRALEENTSAHAREMDDLRAAYLQLQQQSQSEVVVCGRCTVTVQGADRLRHELNQSEQRRMTAVHQSDELEAESGWLKARTEKLEESHSMLGKSLKVLIDTRNGEKDALEAELGAKLRPAEEDREAAVERSEKLKEILELSEEQRVGAQDRYKQQVQVAQAALDRLADTYVHANRRCDVATEKADQLQDKLKLADSQTAAPEELQLEARGLENSLQQKDANLRDLEKQLEEDEARENTAADEMLRTLRNQCQGLMTQWKSKAQGVRDLQGQVKEKDDRLRSLDTQLEETREHNAAERQRANKLQLHATQAKIEHVSDVASLKARLEGAENRSLAHGTLTKQLQVELMQAKAMQEDDATTLLDFERDLKLKAQRLREFKEQLQEKDEKLRAFSGQLQEKDEKLRVLETQLEEARAHSTKMQVKDQDLRNVETKLAETVSRHTITCQLAKELALKLAQAKEAHQARDPTTLEDLRQQLQVSDKLLQDTAHREELLRNKLTFSQDCTLQAQGEVRLLQGELLKELKVSEEYHLIAEARDAHVRAELKLFEERSLTAQAEVQDIRAKLDRSEEQRLAAETLNVPLQAELTLLEDRGLTAQAQIQDIRGKLDRSEEQRLAAETLNVPLQAELTLLEERILKGQAEVQHLRKELQGQRLGHEALMAKLQNFHKQKMTENDEQLQKKDVQLQEKDVKLREKDALIQGQDKQIWDAAHKLQRTGASCSAAAGRVGELDAELRRYKEEVVHLAGEVYVLQERCSKSEAEFARLQGSTTLLELAEKAKEDDSASVILRLAGPEARIAQLLKNMDGLSTQCESLRAERDEARRPREELSAGRAEAKPMAPTGVTKVELEELKLKAELARVRNSYRQLQDSSSLAAKVRRVQDAAASKAMRELTGDARSRFCLHRRRLGLEPFDPAKNDRWVEWLGLPDKGENEKLQYDLGPTNWQWLRTVLSLLHEGQQISEHWHNASIRTLKSLHEQTGAAKENPAKKPGLATKGRRQSQSRGGTGVPLQPKPMPNQQGFSQAFPPGQGFTRPRGFPGQNFAGQQFPSSVFPSPGFTSPGYTSPGFPPQGFSARNFPPQNVPAQGFQQPPPVVPSQGPAPQGVPSPGFSPPGFTSTGFQPREFPSQCVPQAQGFPNPQRRPSCPPPLGHSPPNGFASMGTN